MTVPYISAACGGAVKGNRKSSWRSEPGNYGTTLALNICTGLNNPLSSKTHCLHLQKEKRVSNIPPTLRFYNLVRAHISSIIKFLFA